MTLFIHSLVRRTAVVAMVAVLLFGGFGTAKAATMAELQAQIAVLLAQIQALQGSSVSASFTTDLTIGASGAEVTRLQNWLIAKGYSIPAGATGYFGAQTQAAVAAFQRANGVTPAVGYFGPLTRAKVNAMVVVTPTTPTNPNPSPTTGELRGGAGSVDSYELISGLNNEEVGEDEEDVEVAGLEIEVDQGSDIRLTAVRLSFAKGTATRDFDRYAQEVSLYLDGEEVARVDADEFTKRNSWSKTISLDDDAVIRRGDTGELTVAISGIRNLDSQDEGKTWSVDFTSVRFIDAQKATVTDDPRTQPCTFSFESFATAANVALRITRGEDSINDPRVIKVHNSNRTRNVEILSFNMEARGNSDITIDSLPIEFMVTGADHLDDLASTAYLYVDGDRVASENISADEETVVFDNLDLTLDAGEEYEFVVTVDLLSVSSTLDEGDTIGATIGETETNSAAFDAEDESGSNLSNSDISGSATGGPHAVYETGMQVEFVSATATKSFTADDPNEDDQATYRITFRVTAFDEDIRIDRSCGEDDGSDTPGQGIEYSITNADSNSTSCLLTSSSRDSEDTADTFEVDANKTRTFTLTVVATADGDEFASVALTSINWGTQTNDTNANYYDFNLNGYKTDPVYIRSL